MILYRIENGPQGIVVSAMPVWKETKTTYFLSQELETIYSIRKENIKKFIGQFGIMNWEKNRELKPSTKSLFCYQYEYVPEVHFGGASAMTVFLTDKNDVLPYSIKLRSEIIKNKEWNIQRLQNEIEILKGETSYVETGPGGFTFFELDANLERVKPVTSKNQEEYMNKYHNQK